MIIKKPALTDITRDELVRLVISMEEPVYRVKQIKNHIFQGLAFSFDEMTDLPLSFRSELNRTTRLHSLKEMHRQEGRDGTTKVLYELDDRNMVESVLMSYYPENRQQRSTVCVSTQAGCAIGCPFCATGQQGFIRNLTRGEIIDQVLFFARDLKEQTKKEKGTPSKASLHLSNIVFMGMGEPLANYETLWQAIETLNSKDGFKLGARNMTISTSGLVPQIKRLSHEKLQVGLAVSLHAATNQLRDRLVPINKKYPLEILMSACKDYYRATGRRISFEYVLFKGINDSQVQARALAKLIKGLNCHVNLIPANHTANQSFQPPPMPTILAFEKNLQQMNINVTVRQPRGQDIDAGCGQLRSRFVSEPRKPVN